MLKQLALQAAWTPREIKSELLPPQARLRVEYIQSTQVTAARRLGGDPCARDLLQGPDPTLWHTILHESGH